MTNSKISRSNFAGLIGNVTWNENHMQGCPPVLLYLTWTVTNLIKSFFIQNLNSTYFDGEGGCVSKIGSSRRGGYVYKYDFSWLGKSAEG